ncbi:hypothetical protein VTK56DRAFT_2636 [Thermocarpiscus australiensis]
MDQNADIPITVSQASSQFPLEPVPASVLLEQELARKERLCRKGNLMTGCRELDGYVLLGGFERGSVVGVSAEEEEMGLLIGFQTIAHLLTTAAVGGSEASARAMVITTLPSTMLLPKLREVLVGQLSTALRDGLQNIKSFVQECLERISIARVFDIEGLWEVLGELEDAVQAADVRSPPPGQGIGPRQELNAAVSEEAEPPAQTRTEVLDSEDKDVLSPPKSSPSQEPPPQPSKTHPDETPTARKDPPPSTLPDIILITHTSTLLNALFTGRDKQAAHNTMLLLSSHLHYLTRSPTHSGPLIMLLNSTTSSPAASQQQQHTHDAATAAAMDMDRRSAPSKQPEPTLRSIFNPPLQQLTVAAAAAPYPHPHRYPYPYPYPPGHAHTRRNKPSFGLVFAQLLDLHLLCTRVPRTKADAPAVAAQVAMAPVTATAPGQGTGAGGRNGGVSYVWVVEVLLDEMGVYERAAGDGGWDWRVRRCREQRWAAVAVENGRIVEAF